jgi:hypothetical protein
VGFDQDDIFQENEFNIILQSQLPEYLLNCIQEDYI